MGTVLRKRQIQDLRHSMQRLFRRFGALAAEATPCGKPLSMAHAHALMILAERGELTQQELGSELCIDKSNVARLCSRMLELGHVNQHPGELDRRSRRVSLSTSGRRLACEVDLASRARFGTLLDNVPPQAQRGVLEALGHLVRAVEALSVAGAALDGSRPSVWSEA